MSVFDQIKAHATPKDIIDKATILAWMEQLQLSLEQYPPDYVTAKKYLDKGVDINAGDHLEEGTLLSDIIMGYPDEKAMNPCMMCADFVACDDICCAKEKRKYGSRYLPDVVRFFLENGYDVTKENGRYGAEVLYALCWSSYDKTILEAAKILLDAGADPLYPVADGEDVLAAISWKCSGAIPVEEDLEQECLFAALYDIMEAKTKGLPYAGIQWWDAAIGKQIDRILSCASSPEDAVYEFSTGAHQYQNCFQDDIVLECEGIMLVVTHYCHAYVNPCKIPKDPVDMCGRLGSLVGRRIVDIRFFLNHVIKNKEGRHGATLQIVLDDGGVLVVRDNGDQFDEEYCARFEMTQLSDIFAEIKKETKE